MMQFVLAAFALLSTVTAFPDGAPVCNVGAANVQNQHLLPERKPASGNNEDAGYQTLLAGQPIIRNPLDPTFSNLFQFGVENELVIQSPTGSYLKGFLIIASGGDIDVIDILDTRTPAAITWTDTVNIQESLGCKNFKVASVVQVARTEKSAVSMNFKWPASGQRLFLDVNIVKNNNATIGSQYYFTQYAMVSGSNDQDTGKCGLLGLGIFCPFTFCGIFGRLLGLCSDE